MEMSRHDFFDPLVLFFEPSIRLKFLNQLGSSFLIIHTIFRDQAGLETVGLIQFERV